MVVLNRIYTRTGDRGDTALGSGERVAKNDLRIEAYGTVDETNATVGIARLHTGTPELAELDAMLARIQNDLFDLGADLCVPDTGKPWATNPCASFPRKRPGLKTRSTRSMPSSNLCAPSYCPAAIRPPHISISAAPSAAVPNA